MLMLIVKERVCGIGKRYPIFLSMMDYTAKISGAETIDELLDVERRLNLEAANEKKYGDQLPDFKSRSQAIRTLLADQKLSVRQLASLENRAEKATETGADDIVLETMEEIDQLKAQISQNRGRRLHTQLN